MPTHLTEKVELKHYNKYKLHLTLKSNTLAHVYNNNLYLYLSWLLVLIHYQIYGRFIPLLKMTI